MPYILHIETATKNCSVAIAQNGKLLLCKEIADAGYAHAEKLHIFIADAMQEAGLTFQQLDAVAVSKGPGSYTGLRIGVSAAKGMCYALGIPLIGIDTLAVLAQQLSVENGLIVPMIDARRMEVYSAIFDANKQKIRDTQAEVLTAESFPDLTQTIHFIGDSNDKAKTVLIQDNFVFHDGHVYPSAKDMTVLAYAKFRNREWEDLAYFEPFYLKDFLISKPTA